MWNRFSASGLSIMEDRFLKPHTVIESRIIPCTQKIQEAQYMRLLEHIHMELQPQKYFARTLLKLQVSCSSSHELRHTSHSLFQKPAKHVSMLSRKKVPITTEQIAFLIRVIDVHNYIQSGRSKPIILVYNMPFLKGSSTSQSISLSYKIFLIQQQCHL